MLSRFRSLTLTFRIITAVVLLLLAVVTVNYIVFLSGYRNSAEQALSDKASAFTAVADQAKNHAADLNKKQVFDTEELLADLEATLESGKSYTEARIFGTIPVVAGWTAAQDAAAKEDGIDFNVVAFEARNKKNELDPNSFRGKMLTELESMVKADPKGSYSLSRIDKETNTLHYMRPIQLTADCMMCHGHQGNEWDTDGDGKDVLGFEMEGWEVGYPHGAYEVVMSMDAADEQVASFLILGLEWTIPIVLAGVGAFLLMLRFMFTKPVKALLERIRDIAEGEGDLTQRITVNSNDELGQLGKWFNQFVQRVHDVIVDVSGATREVASAATEIAASAEETSAGMMQQTEQTTQVASAVEEMSSSVVEVARKSSDTAAAADQAGAQASEGNRVVQQTVEGMNAIAEVVNSSANAIAELGKRGEQIGQIIGVINNIAEQTNLLALNAAIEAARAGEHGRGFAVVADEVRKLAESTTQATEEVAESIRAIQEETNSAVTQMNKGTERVHEGVQFAESAGASLQTIMESSGEVARMIQSIAAAAEEQSAVAEQISRNVDSINAVTRQSAEGADQASTAATQLSAKSEQLQRLVGQFRINEDAKASV